MYRPLPEGLMIKKSSIQGHGLVTTKFIEKGTNLGVSHLKINGMLVRTPLGGFLNHSDNPNCVLDKTSDSIAWILHTLKEIKSGEELTVKYELYEVNK